MVKDFTFVRIIQRQKLSLCRKFVIDKHFHGKRIKLFQDSI